MTTSPSTDGPAVADLGAFLRSRRARIDPETIGLPYHGRRRVPGLRREELAMLAGVSLTYYTRLEQGQATNASRSIIDALGRALRLDDDEVAHLRALAQPSPSPRQERKVPEHARDGLVRTISGLPGPAMVLGRHNDILAWNPPAHRVFADHLDVDAPAEPEGRPNQTRLLFLDPHVRDRYRDWDDEAQLAVASLRFVAAQHPDDPGLAQLIGELMIRSERFATLWAAHPVRRCTSGTKFLHHPEVGDLDLAYEVLHVPGTEGHRLLLFSAAPGSGSADALQLLGP